VNRIVALVGIITISFSAILVRLAGTAPITTAFFRAVYALPVLAMIWWFTRADDHRPIKARLVAAGAGVFLSLDLLAWHNAIEDIGAGLATVLANVQVVFVGVGAWLIYRERPTRLAMWLIPVILGGVTLISGLGRTDAYGTAPVRGVVLGVIAGLMYAGFIFGLRAANKDHLAPTAGPLLDATAGLLLGTLALAPLAEGIDLAWSWPAHGWLILIGVGAQSFGWLLIAYALPRLPALETSVLILAQPVLAIVWARLVFDERLSVVQMAGVGLVLGGLVLVSGRSTVPSDVEAPVPANPQ
jgi:drug/metabolite transporter (DMT)-like permease